MPNFWVSVIVPNYNHARYLRQRIESIINQTFQDFELILLDDASTDDSIEILTSFKNHPKVSHFIVNPENSGSPFKQWQKGIELAKGEYIWIAESDDWCELSFLSTMMQAFVKYPKAVLAYSQSYFIKEPNKIEWVSSQKYLEQRVDGDQFVSRHLLFGNAIFNASMAVFKRSTYANVSADFATYKFCGDWLFWSEIAIQGDVFISGKILNYFRNHQEDVSHSAYKSGLNFLEEMQLLILFKTKGLITEDDFYAALRSKYLSFKQTGNKISKDRRSEISQIFLNSSETKRYEKALRAASLRMKVSSLKTKVLRRIL